MLFNNPKYLENTRVGGIVCVWCGYHFSGKNFS